MDCPRCFTTLTAMNADGGTTVDFCPDCGGIFFEKGEFEAFYGLPGAPVQLAGEAQRGVECPGCHKDMREREHGSGEEPLRIDSCPSCEGIWVDRGEGARLRDLVLAMGPGRVRFVEVPGEEDAPAWYVPLLKQTVAESGFQWRWVIAGVIVTLVVQGFLVGIARLWELGGALVEQEGMGRVGLTVVAGLVAFPIGGWVVGRSSPGITLLEPAVAAVPATLLFAALFHEQVGPLLTVGLMVAGMVLALVAAALAEGS